MGRPRKPTPLKILHGDFEKNPQRRNHKEPVVSVEVPDCPAWLTQDARNEWKRVTAELLLLRVISVTDRAALEHYCKTYQLWRKALRVVEKEGATFTTENGIYEHPMSKMARQYGDQIHRALSQFGLTPAARTRVAVSQETPSSRMRRAR